MRTNGESSRKHGPAVRTLERCGRGRIAVERGLTAGGRGPIAGGRRATAIALALLCSAALGDESPAERYRREVLPILEQHCFDCHAEGTRKGNMAFDEFPSDDALVQDPRFWWTVLKNLRAGVMPPRPRQRPSAQELTRIRDWVKADVFNIDPRDPDPGHVTLRRLNREEYRNTIRDLMGIDFDTELEFPPDDTGYGFDTIGDVLSISPLLLEKYLQAAETIVARAVPTTSRVVRERLLSGSEFQSDERGEGEREPSTGDRMTFYQPARVSREVHADLGGDYRLLLELHVDGNFDYDPGRCRVTFTSDGRELLREEYVWQEGRTYRYEFAERWEAGAHRLAFSLEPLSPAEEQKQKLDFRVLSVRVQGPLAERHWVRPERYDAFFPGGPPPPPEVERRAYARWILATFAGRALRRPVEEPFLDRLVAIADAARARPGATFEEGVARAIVSVLASPRFLFRIEGDGPVPPGESHPLVDEYALASRLSYFLWSTMPDEELFRLAGRGELRRNLESQLERMLADPRSEALVQSFTGQWLQARDIRHVSIDPIAALGFGEQWERLLENFRRRRRARGPRRERTPEEEKEFAEFRKLSALREKMSPEIRHAMRRETELVFDYILRQDRSVLEFLDSDYTFVNKLLADHYGIPGVDGDEMRKVTLPEGSPRGGILTQGTFLVVTSNPTRTSPVKRGLFVLDNILGTPAPPPPGAVPDLEESAKAFDHEPTLREVLEVHRTKPLCSSCHSRFDPLGLALENFNALGMWREKEKGRPIDPSGKLITGERFEDIRGLKSILTGEKRLDFYRCLTERLLTFALGRGLDYHDEHTIDQIVERLDGQGGRFSALLKGIVESAPFQKRRRSPVDASSREKSHPPERESHAKPTLRVF